MNLSKVKDDFRVIGGDGLNKYGNCTVCAVMAANALVTGEAPTHRAPPDVYNISEKAAHHGAQKLFELPHDIMYKGSYSGQHIGDHTRAYVVWKWLQRASRGVFLFEQEEDHVYNFVVDGEIYLIDCATQLFRKISTPGDCSVATGESGPYPKGFETCEKYPSNTDFGFNYLSPQPLAKRDSLSVYRWGDLHNNWR